MNTAAFACTHCSAPLPATMLNTAEFVPCPACAAPLLVRAFPALVRTKQAGAVGERVTDAGQATCFYHPHKIAHVPCDSCGRFICALCDVEWQGRHLCPSCLEAGRKKGTLTTFENRRVLWDNIALFLAVVPVATILFWFMTIVTAPASILLAAIGWRKPGSLAPRTKIRFILAIVFSVLVIAGWVTFIFYATTVEGIFDGTP